MSLKLYSREAEIKIAIPFLCASLEGICLSGEAREGRNIFINKEIGARQGTLSSSVTPNRVKCVDLIDFSPGTFSGSSNGLGANPRYE